MRNETISRKSILILASLLGFVFVQAGCSSSGDDAAPVVDDGTDQTITVSGTITNTSGAPLAGVAVQGVYSSPDQAENATDTTDTSGLFSLLVDAARAFYLHGELADYATINSEKGASTADISNLDIGIPTEGEARGIISLAFPESGPLLENHAWLVVDVENDNGDQVGGVAVEYLTSVTPVEAVYTDCDGNDSGGSVTIACPTDRDVPMYIAYFNTTSEITAKVSDDTRIGPVREGEITFLEFEVAAAEPPPAEPTAFELGRDYYDAKCASCHAAGSHDTSLEIPKAGDLEDTSIPLTLNTIPGMSSVSNITVDIQTNLQTFLFDPSI
jgi:hypothetical protein